LNKCKITFPQSLCNAWVLPPTPNHYAFHPILYNHNLHHLAPTRRPSLSSFPSRTIQILKLLPRDLTILQRAIEPLLSRRHCNSQIRVRRKLNNKEAKAQHLQLEQRELLRALGRAGIARRRLLEVLDDVGQALEAVGGGVQGAGGRRPRGHDEERAALEEQDLLGADDLAQRAEVLLDLREVGHEVVDDLGPGFIQGLVPDGGCEGCGGEGVRFRVDEGHALVVDVFTLRGHHEVHFVNEDVDASCGGELAKGADYGAVR